MPFVEHSISLKLAVVRAYFRNEIDHDWSIRPMAKFFGISVSTLYRWRDQYLANGGFTKQMYNRTAPNKINTQIQDYISNKVQKNQYLDVTIVIEEVKKKFKTQISKSSVYKCLKKVQPKKLTYKKVSKRGKKTNLRVLKTFIEERSKIERSKIISLDECSFDTHMTQHHGWSLAGEKCFLTTKNKLAKKRYSLMLAISSSKVVAWQVRAGAYNKQKFIQYINRKLLPQCRRMDFDPVLLMDNVGFHHSKEVKELLTSNRISLLYNPPYHPDSNPIEMLFAFIKAKYRKKPAADVYGLRIKLKKIFDAIDPAMLDRIFRHSETTSPYIDIEAHLNNMNS